MTYAAFGGISSLDLYKLTKIVSKGMVYPQLPAASAIWKKILSNTSGDAKGREQRFEVLTGRGPASFQFSAFNGDFPTFQASDVTEGTVNWKDFDVSIAYDLSLQDKTGEDLVAYAQPYILEMEQKGLSVARSLSAAAMGDGSGVIGVVSSVTASTSTDKLTVVLSTTTANADRSHPGWFEVKDLVKFATTAGTAHSNINNSGTAVTSWRVTSVDQDASTIVMQALDSTGAVIDITTATLGATDPTAADVIYRKGTTANDLTAISTNDYNSISQVFAGLASLTASDGRVVNGLTMSDSLAGSRRSASGNLLTPKDFQKLLSNLKRRTGGVSGDKALTYSEALMHDVVYDVMVEQAEANRTWYNVTDPSTGVSKIGHRHGKTFVEFSPDEFIPFQRIYVLPDQKGPISFLGHDLKQVKVGSASEFLKPSTSGGNYSKTAMSFMSGSGALMTPHPASLGVIENYSLTT
jgi:hypothetical protein